MRPALTALALAAALTAAGPVAAGDLIEPHMHIVPAAGTKEVALTLDACMGAVDMRILDVLVTHRIPATIFATRRWIDNNAEATKLLAEHADLFEIEDHGAQHVPAVIGVEKPYGITPVGTPEAVAAEVTGGAQAIKAATGRQPVWFRGATALYTPDAMALIEKLGYRVGGFSLNGDFGASASAAVAEKRIAGARSGDVIIAHVNQPKRAAGAGVAAGVLALQAKGFTFVKLADATVAAE